MKCLQLALKAQLFLCWLAAAAAVAASSLRIVWCMAPVCCCTVAQVKPLSLLPALTVVPAGVHDVDASCRQSASHRPTWTLSHCPPPKTTRPHTHTPSHPFPASQPTHAPGPKLSKLMSNPLHSARPRNPASCCLAAAASPCLTANSKYGRCCCCCCCSC